ncbi:hypothetical protein PG995_012610 [Apiospora arundinis]
MLSLLLLSFFPAVLAGSAAWQPKLEYRKPLPPLAVETSGYAVRNMTAAPRAQKRWFGMNPGQPYNLWPDNTIKYCFENQAGKTALFNYVLAATQKWTDAGLHRDVYKYHEEENPGDSCVNSANRATILVIRYIPNEERYSANIGLPPLDGNQPQYKGPVMSIGRVADVGNYATIIAHEFGHVWGLAHEHQDPNFWQAPYSDRGGSAFGTNFDCQAVTGYTEALARVRAENPPYEPYLCVRADVAAYFKFAASNLLPDFDARLKSSWGVVGQSEQNVVWESIMMYGSEAFAIDGQRPTLRGNSGDFTIREPDPSYADIVAIEELYEDPFNANHQMPTLHNSPQSPNYAKFTDQFHKSKCSG